MTLSEYTTTFITDEATCRQFASDMYNVPVETISIITGGGYVIAP